MLGYADWIMPGKDNDHRPKLHTTGLPCHVRQELQASGTHGVVVEVVFDGPHRIKTERFCQLGEPDFVMIHFSVREGMLGF